MKSVVSLALLVFLASRPVAAQPQVDPGPIHRALAREISRISIEQGQNHSDSAWRRAVALGAGKQMNVTDREGRVLTGTSRSEATRRCSSCVRTARRYRLARCAC
jgi:hypothetical protein